MRAGTDRVNSATATKRINDSPVLVNMQVPEDLGTARVNLTSRIRTKGAPFMQDWQPCNSSRSRWCDSTTSRARHLLDN